MLIKAGGKIFEASTGQIKHGNKFLTADDADCTDKNWEIQLRLLPVRAIRVIRGLNFSWLTFC
jgi:hypothetical protein